jgi:hypothetical protein
MRFSVRRLFEANADIRDSFDSRFVYFGQRDEELYVFESTWLTSFDWTDQPPDDPFRARAGMAKIGFGAQANLIPISASIGPLSIAQLDSNHFPAHQSARRNAFERCATRHGCHDRQQQHQTEYALHYHVPLLGSHY